MAITSRRLRARLDALEWIAFAPRFPEHLPIVRRALTRGSAEARGLAALAVHGVALRTGRAACTPLVPILIQRLEWASSGELDAVIMAIGAIGPASRQACPTLVRLLSHERYVVREACAEALGGIGLRRRYVTAALTRVAGADMFNIVRRAARRALRDLRSAGAAVIASNR